MSQEITIHELPPKASLALTDELPISDESSSSPAHQNKKILGQDILDLINLNSETQSVYCDQNGVDAVGNGTALQPYATPEYTLSQITDASPTKIYKLVGSGYFTGTNLTLLPNIRYDFTGAFLDYSGFMDADASFDTTVNGGAVIIGGRLRFPGSISFSVSGNNQNIFAFYGTDFCDTQTIQCLQDSSGASQCQLVIIDCLALPDSALNPPIAGPNFNVVNASFIHWNSSASTIFVTNNSTAVQNEASVHSCGNPMCGYTFSSNDSPPLNVDMEASPITGILNIDGNSVALAIDVASYSDAISYTTGATASQVTFKNEAGGLNAGFVPLNYTVTSPQVKQHLQGIDAALGSVSSPWSLVNATVNNNFQVTGSPTIILVNNTSGVYDIVLPDLTVSGSYVKGMTFYVVNIGTQACNVVDYLIDFPSDLECIVQPGTTMQFLVQDDSTQDGTFVFSPVNNFGTLLTGGGPYLLTYPLSEVYYVQDPGDVFFPDATDPYANGSPKSVTIFSPINGDTLVWNHDGGFIADINYFGSVVFSNFSNATTAGDWRVIIDYFSIPVLSRILAQQYSVKLTADADVGFNSFGAANPFFWKDPAVLTDITLTISNTGSTFTGYPIFVHNFLGNTGAIIVTLTGSGSPTFDNDGVTTSLTLNPGDSLSLLSVNSGGVTCASINYLYRVSGGGAVSSVNTLTGAVVVDGTNIDGTYTPVNYTPSSSSLDGYYEGIDDALGSIVSPITLTTYSGSTIGAISTSLDFKATVLDLGGGNKFVTIYFPALSATTTANQPLFVSSFPLALVPSANRNLQMTVLVNNVWTVGFVQFSSGGLCTIFIDSSGSSFPNATPNCGFIAQAISYQI